MIPRRALSTVQDALSRQAAVALIGPRQVGKTTLAHAVAAQQPSVYLDLESSQDRAKLADAALFLDSFEDRLVVLDEVHRVPELFPTLRGLIDRGRRNGRRNSRFLILGSASMDLMRQSSESLAGRIAYVEMGPVTVDEAVAAGGDPNRLWVRGGFPDSLLADSDRHSLEWRRDFIRTYLERDVPMLGPRVPAETLERFWTMLAHGQGALLNAARLAASLMTSAQTVDRYLDLMVDLLLVRRLRPFHAHVGKRLVKSPKVYIRDSGIVHALLGIADYAALAGNPVVGGSWEGFVLENLIAAAPPRTIPGFYRTATGNEIDLVLEIPAVGLWAIEIKRSPSARPEPGFHRSCQDLNPARAFLVHSGTGTYPGGDGVQVVGVADMMALLDLLDQD
jgi:predicted AAA+ superfamily ATPase